MSPFHGRCGRTLGETVPIAPLSRRFGEPGGLSHSSASALPQRTTSKAAVASLTKSLAIEWAQKGVTVNAIAPGVFRTALNQKLLDETGRGKEFLLRTPMKRFGQVEELAGAAVFLASDAASFVNGEVLTVDGGFLASGVNQ